MPRELPLTDGSSDAVRDAAPPLEEGGQVVELTNRLVYSLLRAPIRLAARVGMPLARLERFARMAYFAELRRDRPRDLAGIAAQLGVSIRTAGSINKELRTDFFQAENEVQPLRQVTACLVGQARTFDAIVEATPLNHAEAVRAVALLQEVGWVVETDGLYALGPTLRSFVASDLRRRIDGLNNQIDVITESVWSRFAKHEGETAGARTWVFAAEPEAFAAFMRAFVSTARHGAVDLEEAALSTGAPTQRVAITLSFTSMPDDP